VEVPKRPFLVTYDDGTGGVWAYLVARSREEIGRRFPEFEVVDSRPSWLTDEVDDRVRETLTLDIDDEEDPVLRAIIQSRSR